MQRSGERFAELDGLRGVCAVIVLAWHVLLTYPVVWDTMEESTPLQGWSDPMSWILQTPLAIAVYGSGAVTVFFVLSGFVLALSFERVDKGRYTPFLIKRVVRIWAPFAVAILVSVAGALALRQAPVPSASGWLQHWSWIEPPGLSSLVQHLAMIGTAMSYDTPMWSLVHELRVSIVFPLVAVAAIRAPGATLAAGTVLSLVAVACKADDHRWSVISALETLGYVYLFVAGAVLYAVLPTLRRRLAALPGLAAMAIWAVILATFWAAFWLEYANGPNKWVAFTMGLASIGVVAMVLRGDGLAKLLSRGPARFLGRISYSLYLIHLPVMLIVLHAWGDRPGLDIARIAAVLLCFPAAWLLNVAVERPAQEAGRRLAARATAWRPAAVAAGQ